MQADGSSQDRLSEAPRGDRRAAGSSTALHLRPMAGSSGSSRGSVWPNASATPVAADDKTVISNRPPLPGAPQPLATSAQLLGEALIGQQLEHYELVEFVGGGGMGAVFRANDTRLGRTVAVKVLSRDHTDEETIRRFRNEAQSAARLDHPNIARVYYVGEDQGWNFIVFEFIEGTNLRDAVEQLGPLSLEHALYYTVQIAEALAHSSSRDIVHRDIKPSNVLVTADGEVKLVDMGLARLHQVESSADDLTASGVTLGTFDYISPEQARDPRSADVRSDIYSLGCTLFYVLTGQPPFPEGTALQKLLRHNSDEPPDVRSFRPELPARLSALLAQMLAKRPSQRQQSAGELIDDLVTIGQQLGLASVAQHGRTAVTVAPAAEPWSSRAWQIGGAVALLVIGIVLIDLLSPTRQAQSDFALRPKLRPPAAAAPAALKSSAADWQTEKSPPADSQPSASDSALNGAADAASRPTSPAPTNDLFPVQDDSTDSARADSISSPSSALPTTTAPNILSAAPFDEASASASEAPSAVVVDQPPSADTTGSAGSTVPATAAAGGTATAGIQAKPKRLIVASAAPLTPEAETEYAAGVAEACQRAAELGLTEIELQWNGPRREAPFEITAPRLTLRAAAGYRPVLVFRPRVQVTDRQMIRVLGGSSARLMIQGVELRMELPADPPADGWGLIAMGTGQMLDFKECVLTVQDGVSGSQPLHDQVAMIQVQRRRGDTTMLMDQQLAMAQQATISFSRSIARGDANIVSLADETPLTILWNQGLIATSRRFLESGGSATSPQFYEQIVLDLSHVTMHCREGLYLLRRGAGKSFQFQVAARADHCVFVIDPDVPLYEMVGVSAPPAEEDLQAIGESNRFSQTDVLFLRVRPPGGPELLQEFPLDHRWSKETRSQVGVPWLKAPPLDQPLSTLTKSDLALQPDTEAGFDPALLPNLAPAPASRSFLPDDFSRGFEPRPASGSDP